MSKNRVGQDPWRGVVLAIAIAGARCGYAHDSAEPPLTTREPPACHIDAPSACRVGCDADVPKKVFNVAPNLSGIDLAALHGFEIADILIDDRGDVKDVCLLRGVREDVDVRAVAAIRHWRFEPARLRHSTPPGALVSLVMTVTPADRSVASDLRLHGLHALLCNVTAGRASNARETLE